MTANMPRNKTKESLETAMAMTGMWLALIARYLLKLLLLSPSVTDFWWAWLALCDGRILKKEMSSR